MGRSSSEIELIVLEAIQKAKDGGFIWNPANNVENIIEYLYIVVDQYKEENNKLRLRVQRLEQEIAELRLEQSSSKIGLWKWFHKYYIIFRIQ